MAVNVVCPRQPINLYNKSRNNPSETGICRNSLAKAIKCNRPVGQPGKFIKVLCMNESLLKFLSYRNVFLYGDKINNLCTIVNHGSDYGILPK
ncbi:protein of unknown function [Magnetospirillum sp. XM-1]|nr:protein of unknown function [Magnetospirillum sp. XM-1]